MHDNAHLRIVFVLEHAYIDTRMRRCFRLFLSSKFGKDTVLHRPPPVEDRHFALLTDRQFFMESLICNVATPAGGMPNIISYANPTGDKPVFVVAPLHADTSVRTHALGSLPMAQRESPYPAVDEFVLRTWRVVGQTPNATIKSVVFLPTGSLVLYTLSGSRFCCKVDRHHKSNNITLIADVARAVMYQKCLDPDCRRDDFRSNEFPIPAEMLPSALSDAEMLADVVFDSATSASAQHGDCAVEVDEVPRGLAMLEWGECHANPQVHRSGLGGDCTQPALDGAQSETCNHSAVGGDGVGGDDRDDDSWWHDEATLRAADALERDATVGAGCM
jgi:hypothetical protein